jgi:hypothetical protein
MIQLNTRPSVHFLFGMRRLGAIHRIAALAEHGYRMRCYGAVCDSRSRFFSVRSTAIATTRRQQIE